MSMTVLGFDVAGKGYGINLAAVREVTLPMPPVSVPLAPGFVRGLVNLRGELVVLVDMGFWLWGKPSEITQHSRILLLNSSCSDATGLLVDGLREARTFHSADLLVSENNEEASPLTRILQGLCKWDEGVITLVDAGKLGQILEKAIENKSDESSEFKAIQSNPDMVKR